MGQSNPWNFIGCHDCFGKKKFKYLNENVYKTKFPDETKDSAMSEWDDHRFTNNG